VLDERDRVIGRHLRTDEKYPRHAREDGRVMSLVGHCKAV